MKTGKTISQLATEVTALRNASRDFRLPQNALRMTRDAKLLTAPMGVSFPDLVPNDLMHEQLADKLNVPLKYYNRMRAEAPALLASNVNEWLERGNDRRFVRTFCNEIGAAPVGRAFLGGSYRPLDNYDMITAIMPPMQDAGLQVVSSEVTDRRLYLQLTTPRFSGEVKKGDVVQLGLVAQNSEVGCGSLTLQVLVYRLACLNGLITATDLPGFRKVHIGWSAGEGSQLSDDTRRLKDAATWSEARDLIKVAVTQTTMDNVLGRLRGIAAVELPNPEAAVEIVAERFALAEDERSQVMKNLIAGGDVSQWGLTNAVTALAHTAAHYDRSVELETIGGRVAALPAGTFANN